ncbi:uncharacterized protein LOC111829223, partial [Capsella rubella]|uniref:uncharacterized protein LOC111829223 n=1 Tax=Capsella rubella TaxID=81985 RepID=UPI000CD4ED68
MITKVLTNKFNGPFYSWSCVPQDRRERYFVEFAKTHTWDPLVTGTVQKEFEKVCKRRIKDMVSNVRTSRERPSWIVDTLWQQMVAHWDTDAAQQRSLTYSKARMSDRNGLGPHIHLSGPKSYQQIQSDMKNWEELSLLVRFSSQRIQSQMERMLIERQRKLRRLMRRTCKQSWMSSRRILQRFQADLHNLGNSRLMIILPYFFSPLRRTPEVITMELAASKTVLEFLASASDQ